MKHALILTACAGLCACATTGKPVGTVAPAPAGAGDIVIRELPPSPPPGMQWLYGSGEAGASSIQAYHAMRDHVLAAVSDRPADSVVLAEGSTLDRPRFTPCGDKPFAVLLDVDETVIQNLGYEYHEAVALRGYDQKVWDEWERTGAGKVAPIPGAVTALRAIRQAGVTVIFNSNRKAENAGQSAAAIDMAGLGPVKHGETLFLQGDDATGSAKDGRRARIAARWCVIAMAGDQLGDFSDLFNAKPLPVPKRRDHAISGAFAAKWGDGWFMLPNPVYGPGVRGTYDDVFPADKRWLGPAKEK